MNAKRTATKPPRAKTNRAKFGAAAYEGLSGKIPTPFPRHIGGNAMAYLKEVVDSGLTCNMTERFEAAFAKTVGVKHCIATPGCTPALAVLAASLRLKPGDEVIFSPVTDYGTLMGFIKEDIIPVFADTAPGSINLSAKTIEPCITGRTRAVVVVHKTGIICDMDPINALAKKHGLIVIEDCCQAVMGRYKGRLAGTLGHAAGFSFDSEKTMGSDTGGCLVTNDDDLASYARFIGHSRGAEMRPGFGRIHSAAGYAHRMPLCTAAISLAQLEIVHENVQRRDRIARLITSGLAKIPGVIPLPIPKYLDTYSCWMLGFNIDPTAFTCTVDEFAQQCDAMGLPGAGTARYYLMPAALTFLQEMAASQTYPFSTPPTAHGYKYSADNCPTAAAFLDTFIRWVTVCDKYTDEHCATAVQIVRAVAERNRK
ncbi:MAG: DegT/DnrJ/EryC1/StrS family aminotransferase [Planctomycetes bacterium]|nr:DegT/DnrJ/EryC1/StrS family aminotransferase [Planctomycetota bacterium]